MISHLTLWDMASGRAHRVLSLPGRVEAPNWHPDGQSLLVNHDGGLFAVPLDRPRLVPLPTGILGRCNNDHGFSPDGRQIVFSAHRGRGAEMFVMSANGGGDGRAISDLAPSWFHGWRPDGGRLVYAGVRGGGALNIFSCPAPGGPGGPEVALTHGPGHKDGPDYSADGRHIYFNSDRGGHAQIWVMAEDGSNPRPLFSDERVNWFPHPSSDGRHLIWLSYPPGTQGHPADLPVQIWRADPDGASRAPLLSFVGGQGSLNVPSWAPDSRGFAFVSYDPGQAA